MVNAPTAQTLESVIAARAPRAAKEREAIHIVEVEGHRIVLKWARRKPWENARAWLAALGCWLVFAERVPPSRLRTGGIAQEAERLRRLARSGRRVPEILLHTQTCLVLSWVGESLDKTIPALSTADKIALFERVVDDLADWHRHGRWHGSAQLRNLTEYAGTLYRIDFEERHGHILSAPATRAYDLLLLFGDMLMRLPATQVLPQGRRLLQRYLAQVEDPALGRILHRLLRLLKPVQWLCTRWPRLGDKHDSQRIVRFAQVLQVVLPLLPPLL